MNGRIVFFGTSQVCVNFLRSLNSNYHLPLIITTPDTKGDRRKRVIEPPVKLFALENNIDLLQPNNLSSPKIRSCIADLNPDIGVVISYGKLIPDSIISLFKHNIINVHFSLLPKYRGAAPVQRAIQDGLNKTGVTIFEINNKMDAGDIYSKVNIPISIEDTSQTLFNKMCNESQEFLLKTIESIFHGTIKKKRQDHSKSTFAPVITKQEGIISWDQPALSIYNKYRAFTPWPSVYCNINNKFFKLTKILPIEINHNKIPGTIFKITRDSLIICCQGSSALEVIKFQPPNKKPMTPYAYSLGNEFPSRLN